MRKALIIFTLLFAVFHLQAQINTALNFNYGHTLNYIGMNELGCNAVAGYTFKRKLDINIKAERLNWTIGYKYLQYKQTSFQLELKYHIIGIKRSTNPYIGIGAGYFIKTDAWLNETNTYTMIGFLPTIGALTKLQAVKNQLYLDVRLSYCNVQYNINPFSYLSLSAGLLFYFKDTPAISK